MSKNVCFFHHYATPLSMSGMQRPSYFAKQLALSGYKTTVFAAAYLHYSNQNLIENKKDLYVVQKEGDTTFVFVRTPAYTDSLKARVKNMLAYFWNVRKAAKQYFKEHPEAKPDVIIASSPHPFTMAAGIFAGRTFKVPCICEVRDFWPEGFFLRGLVSPKSIFGRLLLHGERWIYTNADAMIFLKEGDVNYLKEQGWDENSPGGNIPLEKCFYINNGIDLPEYLKMREEPYDDPDLKSGKFTVVYVGSVRRLNNLDHLLDCAKYLQDKEDIEFLVFGDGNMLPALKERVAKENITNVKFKGAVPRKAIPAILAQSGVALMCYTNTEYNWSRGNSSNKLFEYFAAGKPVISTIKMGYDIIEKYQCGFSDETYDPQKLAALILKVKEMPPDEYKQLCDNAMTAARDFDFSALTERLKKVIEYVIAKRRNSTVKEK